MGDFNLHSPKWDLEVEQADAKADTLSNYTASAGLMLLNDVDKPTWTQPGKKPSVIDLAFAHLDLFEKYAPSIKVDLDNRVADHASIVLEMNPVQESISLKKALPPGSEAYSRFIKDAAAILTSSNVSDISETCTNIADAFNRHSIVIQEKKMNGWWTQQCSDAKLAYRISRSEADKSRWYKIMKQARNDFFCRKVKEANDKDNIWHLLKWKQPRPSPKYVQLTDNEGKPIQDNNQVFEAFHQHFNGAMDDILMPPPRCDLPSRMWHDITTQDIKDALKATSDKSAPGPDGIGWAIWKNLAQNSDALEGILNSCKSEGCAGGRCLCDVERCINCNGGHRADSNECPFWLAKNSPNKMKELLENKRKERTPRGSSETSKAKGKRPANHAETSTSA